MNNVQRLFGVAVVVVVAAGLNACGGGGGGGSPAPTPTPTPPPPPPPPPPPAGSTGTLNGLVYSAATGAAVNGATASVDGLAATTTTASGSFQLAGVTASERVLVRVSAPGFVDTVAVAAVRGGAVTLARVTLLPVGTSASVDPAASVSVTASDSPAQIAAAANSFVRADNGAAPTGSLTVRLTAVDPARDANRMPGDFTTGGAAAQQIESFGAIAVDIRDAANNRYDLAGGRTATIRIPVSTREASPPATIPLFYLDETSGRWVEQGSATLAGTGATRHYEGTVSHFSYWNADRPYETVYITGCVQTAAGLRTRNRTVTTDGLDYTGTGRTFSDTNGDFRVPLRRNSQAVLTIQGGTETIAPTVVGPLAADTTLPACLVERGNTTILPPAILVQPAGVTVDEGGIARFSVVADGAIPLRFQWRRNGADIPGAVGSAYTVFATAADNGAVYSVVITNGNGTVTSGNATLTVNVPNTPPAIGTQPASVTVQVGQVASFSVSASGAPPLAYQWRRNGTPIAGATASSYLTPPTTLADSGSTFDVVVTNNLGSATSAAATLTVTNAPPAAGTYKRALAGLIAATYNVGCANGAGAAAGPIVIAANGDVSWDGGSMPLSSLLSSVTLGNGYTTFGISSMTGSISDGAISRALSISNSRSPASNTSSVEVTATPVTTRIVRCDPGLTGGFAQPNLNGLVTTWMQGVSSSLQCSVRIGSSTSTQTVPFSVASGQVTLGSFVIALSAARTAEAISATDAPTQPADSLFAYSAQFADNSNLSFTRFVTSTALSVTYILANGDRYVCSGSR